MRISDWSSDVCSSDLRPKGAPRPSLPPCSPGRSTNMRRMAELPSSGSSRHRLGLSCKEAIITLASTGRLCSPSGQNMRSPSMRWAACWLDAAIQHGPGRSMSYGSGWRSEEHTYELQSLMRSSYAVFCLKKKHTKQEYDT